MNMAGNVYIVKSFRAECIICIRTLAIISALVLSLSCTVQSDSNHNGSASTNGNATTPSVPLAYPTIPLANNGYGATEGRTSVWCIDLDDGSSVWVASILARYYESGAAVHIESAPSPCPEIVFVNGPNEPQEKTSP